MLKSKSSSCSSSSPCQNHDGMGGWWGKRWNGNNMKIPCGLAGNKALITSFISGSEKPHLVITWFQRGSFFSLGRVSMLSYPAWLSLWRNCSGILSISSEHSAKKNNKMTEQRMNKTRDFVELDRSTRKNQFLCVQKLDFLTTFLKYGTSIPQSFSFYNLRLRGFSRFLV